MGSSPVGVQCTFNYHFPCVSVLCLPFQNVYFLNQSIKYSFIDKKDNPPDTNASGFYRRVGGGKGELVGSSLHHSFTSSSHSLFGFPLFVFPSISPNTTSYISLLSSILHMCPNKLNFFSLILCMMFLFLPIPFLISSFVIFCCHLTFRILR